MSNGPQNHSEFQIDADASSDVSFDPDLDRCPDVDITDAKLHETLSRLCLPIPATGGHATSDFSGDAILGAHQLESSGDRYQWPPEFLDDDEALELPVRIGDFRQITPIRCGRHAYLCLAYDEALGRNVALKIARSDTNGVPFDLGREIDALGRVNDDRVVKLLQVVQQGDRKIPVLEWIDGWSLDRWITQLPLTVGQAAAITVEVVRGLEAMAAVGLVHRDIKPSNLMIGQRGMIKIVDLGTALMRDGDVSSIGEKVSCGTPQYMAPEQSQDSDMVDHSADLFSLGITLVELISGNRPAHRNGDDLKSVSDRKMTTEIRSLLPRSTPTDLVELTIDLTRKRPQDRITDHAALIARLKPHAESVELRELADRLSQTIETPVNPSTMLAKLSPPVSSSGRSWRFIASVMGIAASVLLLALLFFAPWQTQPAGENGFDVQQAQQRLDGVWPINQAKYGEQSIDQTLQIGFRADHFFVLDQGRVIYFATYRFFDDENLADAKAYTLRIKPRGRRDTAKWLDATAHLKEGTLTMVVRRTQFSIDSDTDSSSVSDDPELHLTTESAIPWPITRAELPKLMAKSALTDSGEMNEVTAEKARVELKMLAERSPLIIRKRNQHLKSGLVPPPPFDTIGATVPPSE